jgi:D-3-phosphoglycerate dehydrogenase / 2-oxoglutarate reductase
VKISILDDFGDTLRTLDCFSKLDGHDVTIWNDHTEDTDVLANRLADTEALVLIRERTPIQAPLLERLANLKLICQHSQIPHIDVATCTRLGILVCSDIRPGYPSHAAAELTWGLVISGMRYLPQEVASMKAGQWQRHVGSSLRKKTMGLFGYGMLGKIIAGYAKAFDMSVVIWDEWDKARDEAVADGIEVAESKEDLFTRADVLSVHLRLVDSTRGIITRSMLDSMKPDALLVNTSRAELIEEGAIVAALEAGHPGKYCVDVYETEPMVDLDYPLLHMDNVICSPHIGYVSRDQWEIQFTGVFSEILGYDRGEPENVVNADVLTHARHRDAE